MDWCVKAQLRARRGVVLMQAHVPSGSDVGLAYGVDWRGESVIMEADISEVLAASGSLAAGRDVYASLPQQPGDVVARGWAADAIARRWPAPAVDAAVVADA